MKTKTFLILIILVMTFAFVPKTFAQNPLHWQLPEGVKIRINIGKDG